MNPHYGHPPRSELFPLEPTYVHRKDERILIGFDDYQEWTRSFVRFSEQDLEGLYHCVLGLCGEAGETADKVKRINRDDNGQLTEERKAAIVEELSDVCWYLAAAADSIGVSFSDIIRCNIDKLESRRARGVLRGEGDKR